MKKTKLFIAFIAPLLFACESPPVFDASVLAKTWNCKTNDHVSSQRSTIQYKLDGSLRGSSDVRVNVAGEKDPALLKIFVTGTWTIEGNKFTENIDVFNIEPQNESGFSIQKKAESIANKMRTSHSEIIAVEAFKVTYKEVGSYFERTCELVE